MADIIRDVIIKIAIKQDEVRLKSPDLGPILLPIREVEEKLNTGLPDAFKEFEKDAVKSVKEIGDEVEELTKGIEGIKPALEETSKASEEAQRKLTDDTLKMNEGFRTAGEGAFTLARGIVFVGIAAEEDLQKAIQAISQIQGAFDIFKGGIDVVKGLVEGTRALRLVATSAAIAETGLATANTAVAVTGAAATTSMSGLLLVLGPIGIALGLVGAAFLFFRDAPGDIEKTNEELEKQRGILQQISNIKLGIIDLQLEFGDQTPEERIASLRKKLNEEIAKITRDAEAGIKKSDADISAARTALADKAANRDLGVFSPAGKQALEAEDARLRAALAETEAAKNRLIQDRETAILGKNLKLNRDIVAVRESQREKIQSTADLAEQEIQAANKVLQTSKDNVELEKKAVQAVNERFVALKAIDQFALQLAVKAKAEGRDVTERGAGLLSSVLGQPEELARVQRERAIALGGEELFKTSGVNNKLIQAQENALIVEEKFGGNDGVISGLETTLKTVNDNMGVVLELIQKAQQKQAEFETTLDKLNN